MGIFLCKAIILQKILPYIEKYIFIEYIVLRFKVKKSSLLENFI